jgi:hypothetical protein
MSERGVCLLAGYSVSNPYEDSNCTDSDQNAYEDTNSDSYADSYGDCYHRRRDSDAHADRGTQITLACTINCAGSMNLW